MHYSLSYLSYLSYHSNLSNLSYPIQLNLHQFFNTHNWFIATTTISVASSKTNKNSCCYNYYNKFFHNSKFIFTKLQQLFKIRVRSCLNFIEKYFYYCEAAFGFFESILGIFYFLSFGNSPLFPARCERKPTRKQLTNNPK